VPRFRKRRTSRSRARRYVKKLDPEVWLRRFGQEAPVARASWVFTSVKMTATEEPILEALEGTTVPPEKYAYFLATGKEALEAATTAGAGAALDELTRVALDRIWRDITTWEVEAIYERSRELGGAWEVEGWTQVEEWDIGGGISLDNLIQATGEIVDPQTIENAVIPVEVGSTMGEEYREATQYYTSLAGFVDSGTTDWTVVGGD
jgi:hypothetical protein